MRASLPPRRPKKKPLRGNKPGLPRGSSLPPLKISYIVTLASVCYAKGDGISQSYTEAVKWLRLAAEQGHADAQFYLGVCYYYDYGVAKNRATAIRWYKKAAAQGNSTAQDNLRKLGVYDW